MNRFLLLFLLAIASFQLNVLAQQKILHEAVERAEKEGFSGVILVAENGKILFEDAMGMRTYENRILLHEDDTFELASLSKQFTAMMIMMCEEKGLLAFDDQAAKYIETPYPGITIRHLLTHTSGLPDYQAIMDAHWDKSKVAGNQEILEYLREYAPVKSFEPGEQYEYSNTGYVLLASIVEKATGKDFVELMREWIFQPLKMKSTDIRSLAEKAEVQTFAAGHLKNKEGHYVNANTFHSSDYTVWLGNRKGPGRVSSNVEDLLKWDQALYSNTLVSEETLEEAFTPFKLTNERRSYYGFGWEIEPKSPFGKMVMHTGDNPGYKTIIVRFIEENKTIIILNNNAHPDMMRLVEAATLSLGKW
ncbi:CubicO group peptidase (beta-lactamase class C family) [Algoriphagus ratkowskyi]|uniref:Beta-lactamase family protein n=1 Tax=Algoriphagus ratkowskyi TaxID=57028 RepID=A0A2W7RIK0_9BACT|nr:serine hydrolase domain-containing protein [Algoriphagus ratkowskyi]PZX58240.1 CubicO group peptidase (beta-lactamase class C family) [Algoriphagus ratkowskyi]TXD77880.1 beta-lactamase family protein [Algoriphagus ratkowskyi]